MNTIEEATQQIIDYADNDTEYGWLKVHVEGRNYKLPKRAMILYTFGKSLANQRLLPKYNAFSGDGWKMQMDNRYHTDVLLGAGFDLDQYVPFQHDIMDEVLYAGSDAIEKEFHHMISFDFVVLANGQDERYFGDCMVYEYEPPLENNTTSNIHIDCATTTRHGYRCIVIPHAGIEFAHAAKNADIIITERGGSLCHLGIVSAEGGKLLIRMDDAVNRFSKFSKFSISLNSLSLELTSN